MRDRPSFTAAWVAAARSFGVHLPEDARLADDPYGARFARTTSLVGRRALSRALFPDSVVLYMQVRTRVIDDALLAFVRDGGTQVVLLGAGFDCRALRFARELASSTVFEVDHPATQKRKREVLAGDVGAHTEYVPWNFESDSLPMSALPAELARHGHDASKRTFTIWEGVTMYLSDDAIEASVQTMRDYSASGSGLAMTYVDRELLDHPSLRARVAQAFVSRVGEPFRFGWHPSELPAWMRARGFEIARDHTAREWGRELLPEKYVVATDDQRRFAICTRVTDT